VYPAIVRRRTLLALIVGLTALLVIATALAGSRSSKATTAYRFTGAVENGQGIPLHFARASDGFAFSFFDALSRGVRSEPYTVCVGRPGRSPAKCWKRSARFGVSKLSLGATLPRQVPYGELIVKWSMAGRTVAKWPLLYMRGE
jgi:hypothetical protein